MDLRGIPGQVDMLVRVPAERLFDGSVLEAGSPRFRRRVITLKNVVGTLPVVKGNLMDRYETEIVNAHLTTWREQEK